MDQTTSQNAALEYLASLPSDDPSRPDVKRIDTHANIVFLVGSKAYKVKRAVKYPFLDYSTLALRKEACQAEITYNKSNAPKIYLQALPIARDTDGTLALAGTGEILEWAVEMNRFKLSDELEVKAGKAAIEDALSEQLADMMVAAHAEAPLREGSGFYQELATYVEQNNEAFHEHPDLFPTDQVRHLTETSRTALEFIRDLILKRGEQGLVRRCHGDAHLRNIVLIDEQPVLFDAIEFSDAIATNDVLYDLAFLLMDLWERNQHRAANHVFNRYLDKTRLDEHPEGLAVLPFYLMMRAAIRSKIAASSALNQSDPKQKAAQQEQARTYFRYALDFLEPSQPLLTAIGGLSGSGKTTLAYSLAPDIGRAPGARVMRTDVMRKRMLGLNESDKAPDTAYTKKASDDVYHAIDGDIQSVLAAGHSAIFDAVFASESERNLIQNIAARVEASFTGLWLTAPTDILKKRVANREGDASDATVDVVDQQLNYELGTMSWAEINAADNEAATLADARSVIRKA
ncbi:MAG: AAA family ATPase [Roseibium sp.]